MEEYRTRSPDRSSGSEASAEEALALDAVDAAALLPVVAVLVLELLELPPQEARDRTIAMLSIAAKSLFIFILLH
jgi:hypothetical protein